MQNKSEGLLSGLVVEQTGPSNLLEPVAVNNAARMLLSFGLSLSREKRYGRLLFRRSQARVTALIKNRYANSLNYLFLAPTFEFFILQLRTSAKNFVPSFFSFCISSSFFIDCKLLFIACYGIEKKKNFEGGGGE